MTILLFEMQFIFRLACSFEFPDWGYIHVQNASALE